MNDYCIHLNLHFQPFREDVDLHNLPKNNWNLISKDLINPQLIDFLKEKDINISVISSFYDHYINFFSTIHIDSPQICDMSKLIWVWGEHHMMYWYRHKEHVIPNIRYKVNDTSPDLNLRHYCEADREQLDVVHCSKIEFPSLIQVGVYHRCVTFSGPRRSLTMVLEDSKGNAIPMSAAKSIFQSYIKE
jgi:hypothetical protein